MMPFLPRCCCCPVDLGADVVGEEVATEVVELTVFGTPMFMLLFAMILPPFLPRCCCCCPLDFAAEGGAAEVVESMCFWAKVRTMAVKLLLPLLLLLVIRARANCNRRHCGGALD